MNKNIEAKKYKEVNGTSYYKKTPDDVIRILERIRENRNRVRFCFGNIQTGEDWEEMYDTCGYIGRSTGPLKVLLLINNSRSFGGGCLLTDCIVKIEYSNKKNGGIIYQHPNYHR